MGTLVDDPQVEAFRQLTDPAVRDEFYMSLELERRRIDAVLLAITADVDTSGRFGDDGHAHTANWLSAITNSSLAEAKRRVRAATMMNDLAVVSDAFADGHIGDEQLEQFRLLYSNFRVRPYLAEAAGLLVEHASLLPYPDFVTVCQRFKAWADPDGTNRDHDACRENRAMSQSREGVGFRIHARGDAVTGSMIEQALAPFIQSEFEKDWAEGRQRYGDAMRAVLMARSATQRRYDAFAKMCAAAGDGTGSPTVNINVDDDTVEQILRSHLDNPNLAVPEWTRRHCETLDGAPVSHNDLLIALLVGNVRKVVRDNHGRVIHLGRKRRLFTGAAREAALAGGERCIFAGCHVRGRRLHVDHTVGWATARGTTDPDNANIECGPHNRAKERLRQSVEPHPTMPRAWITRRHNGTTIGPRTSPRTIRLQSETRRRTPPTPGLTERD